MANIFPYVLIVFCVILLAVGQILFKVAANSMEAGALWFDRQTLMPLGAAATTYAFATAAWVWALRSVPLSKAYPFVAIGFVIVPAASWWLFRERIGGSYLFGVLLICVGILLTIGDQ